MQLSNQDKILDISVNLARVSDWVSDERKQKRVDQFLQEIQDYIATMSANTVSPPFRHTLELFRQEFALLLFERDTIDKDVWAEKALTWANILQHRAKLA